MPVGYSPQTLGRTRASWYEKDATGRLVARSASINFLFVPTDLFGASAETQHDARWGAGSFKRFKWQGLDNESRLSVAAAMTWACQAKRGDLLGWNSNMKPPGVDCMPSDIEIIDSLATGHGAIIGAAHQIATGAPGTSPDLAITVRDARDAQGAPRVAGLFSERDPYWPLTRWYMNVVTVVKPPDPPDSPEEPEVPAPEPPAPVTPIDQRAREIQVTLLRIARAIPGGAIKAAAVAVVGHPEMLQFYERAIEIYRRGKT